MKIYAVIRNMGTSGEWEKTPFGAGDLCYYQLADSDVVRSGNPIFLPEFSEQFTAYFSIAVKICKLGKCIAPKFAHRYAQTAAMAYNIVGDSLLEELREKGLPWTEGVSFDRSCLLGNFEEIDTFKNNGVITLRCGEKKLLYDPQKALDRMGETISHISRHNTLKTGDIILLALSPAGLPLAIGEKLTSSFDNNDLTSVESNIR